MSWTKSDLAKIKGKVKGVYIPAKPKNKVEIPKSIGKYKLHLIQVLENCGLKFIPELQFSPDRKFRFDWAIPSLNLAIEYEGIFSEKSGHTTISGFTKDVEKYNLATKNGWKILRYTADNYLDFEDDLKALIKS